MPHDFDSSGMTLSQAKTTGKKFIDLEAGSARARYITFALGQEMTYLEKAEEATDYAAAGYPVDTSGYPFVAADATAYSITPQQAADQIIAQRTAWITVGAQIEQARLTGKGTVEAATTLEDVETAVNAATLVLSTL